MNILVRGGARAGQWSKYLTLLNMPEVVRLLLEECADCVSVDGMDCHGATALMCKIYP